MADLDTSIPLQSKAPNSMQSLSSLLGVAQNALAYKKSQQTFDADVAQRQAESSTAQSSAAVNAATVTPRIQQQAAQTETAQTGAAAAKFGLQKDFMGTALQTAAGLTQDPRIAPGPNYSDEAAASAINEAEQQMIAKGVPPVQAKMATAPLYMQVHTPGAVQQMLKNTITGGMSPQGQAGAIAPSGPQVGNGIQTGYVNTNPLAAPVGSPIAGTTQTQLVPLGQQQGAGTDVNGNPVVTHRDAYGNIQAPTTMPGSNAAPQISFPAGESGATKGALEQEALNAKNTAMAAPGMHANNQGILHELNNVAATGSAGQLIAKTASILGVAPGAIPGATEAEKAASAYDLIGKYTERNALQAAAAMGPGTNAGLEAQIKANGSAAYNPTALKTVTRLNDAVVTGSEKYAQGLQQAIDSGGKGVFAKRQFDQQWAQNADVNTLRFLNASKTGDQEEVQNVLKAVGGPGSTGAKKLAQQLQNLQSLTTKGSL